MTYPKRLIEVDFPIKRISSHSRLEKDMRIGHIPNLHIYPAARPLAACRATACAALWPDPADSSCPEAFIAAAEREMRKFAEEAMTSRQIAEICDNDAWRRYCEVAKSRKPITPVQLRALLLDFIADFAAWDASANAVFLMTAKNLTRAAHEALGGASGTRPLVVDTFAGGGAIPLEALRIGADAFASDLNPLAVLIDRVVLEAIPRFGPQLLDHLDRWTRSVKEHASAYLSRFYPEDSEGNIPVAYIWARTILSEAPGKADVPVEVPLLRSMWLARKGRRVALRWARDRSGNVIVDRTQVTYSDGSTKRVRRPRLEVFQPQKPSEVPRGTVARSSATCPITGYTTPAERVCCQLKARSGGARDARLCCVVTMPPSRRGRSFHIPSSYEVEAFHAAERELELMSRRTGCDLSFVPDEPLPEMSGVFNAPLYGHSTWGSLFNQRQALALATYSSMAKEYAATVGRESPELAAAIAAVLGFVVDRLADLNASLCVWQLNTPNNAHVFGRWALPMVMDYAEVNPLAGAGGSPESAARRASSAIRQLLAGGYEAAQVGHASATDVVLPDASAQIFFTDPPYYNAIPYADISDFFYVWLRRTVLPFHADILSRPLAPKEEEICEMAGWDPLRYPYKDKAFFERGMTKALGNARRFLQPSGLGVVVFAHKSTDGWEAMLQAVADAGFVITASWPIDTEMASRLRAKGYAALASSVHIVCRPRDVSRGLSSSADVGDWREVLAALPKRIHEWLPRLADEGVVGADAIFACLGPALEVFSRYSRVEKASGEQVSLRDYLEYVWAAVSQEALRMVFRGADATGFEEDARLTAMWLWTLRPGNGGETTDVSEGDGEEADDEPGSTKRKTGGYALEYDAARKIAQGLGAHLEALHSIIAVEGETARLLLVSDRTGHLFGKTESAAPVGGRKKRAKQMALAFTEQLEEAESAGEWTESGAPKVGKTTLDRVHQSMILFAASRSEALKRFLVEEGVGRDGRFWTLAQALSALYPTRSDEKRWVDGVLAKKKGLGL